MSRHNPDLTLCRKQPGIAIGRLCEKCDGKCVICDALVNSARPVRICDECNFGATHARCIVCGSTGTSDAYYCRECVAQEKDRDGCPRVVSQGTAKADMVYDRRSRMGAKRPN